MPPSLCLSGSWFRNLVICAARLVSSKCLSSAASWVRRRSSSREREEELLFASGNGSRNLAVSMILPSLHRWPFVLMPAGLNLTSTNRHFLFKVRSGWLRGAQNPLSTWSSKYCEMGFSGTEKGSSWDPFRRTSTLRRHIASIVMLQYQDTF